MAGRSFFSLDRTKVRAFVREGLWPDPIAEHCPAQCGDKVGVGIGLTNDHDFLPHYFAFRSGQGKIVSFNDTHEVGEPKLRRFIVTQDSASVDNGIEIRAVRLPFIALSRRARQHGQRKNQSLHLQSPVLRNSRHHRVRLRGCQHPRPAGTGAFRAGLGHTARGRGRPHLSAPFTSLLDCGRHYAGVARIFPAVRGGAL